MLHRLRTFLIQNYFKIASLVCQGLVTSKHQFIIKLSLGKYTFDFNNKEMVNSFCEKKKKLPCQIRREERRKIEIGQKVKIKDTTVKVTELPESTNFKCEQCNVTCNFKPIQV